VHNTFLSLDTNKILAYCTISKKGIFKNNSPVFEKKGLNAHDFMLTAYADLGLNYPKFYKMDSLSKLGWLASEVLLKDSYQPSADLKADEIGLVLSNANSSLDTDIKYLQTTETFASPSLFVYTLPNIVMGEICIRHRFKGENAFFVSQNFDPNFIEQYVNNLLNNNILQACICGWVDILKEDFNATLFWVTKSNEAKELPFTKENVEKIYQSQWIH
jgi:hypothetical protein